jgi:hypothetical protein
MVQELELSTRSRFLTSSERVKLRISTKTAAIRGGNVEMSPSMAPLGAGARFCSICSIIHTLNRFIISYTIKKDYSALSAE